MFIEGEPIERVVDDIQERMEAEGKRVTTVSAGDVNAKNGNTLHNQKVFLNSGTIADARQQLRKASAVVLMARDSC